MRESLRCLLFIITSGQAQKSPPRTLNSVQLPETPPSALHRYGLQKPVLGYSGSSSPAPSRPGQLPCVGGLSPVSGCSERGLVAQGAGKLEGVGLRRWTDPVTEFAFALLLWAAELLDDFYAGALFWFLLCMCKRTFLCVWLIKIAGAYCLVRCSVTKAWLWKTVPFLVFSFFLH